MSEELERARNAGFVEASRIHGAEIERLRGLLRRARMYVPGDVRIGGAFLWDSIDAALAGPEPRHQTPENTADQPTACLHEWEQQDFYLLCRKCEATMDVELTTVPTDGAT